MLRMITRLGCGWLMSLVVSLAAEPVSSPYTQQSPSQDGIGKIYLGREISQVMGHRGAGWLERSEREREERPAILIRAMRLQPGHIVADIGAGSGYFTFRISPVVADGRVLAVDIQPEMLRLIRKRAEKLEVKNVEGVLGTIQDPHLPPGTVDAVLMVDAYHEFSHPHEMMQGIMRGLKPGGRVFLVEYRGEDPEVPIKPLHKMTEAQARREMEAVGLEWVETLDALPRQHILVFRKPV